MGTIVCMQKIIFPLLIVGFALFALAPSAYELSRAGDLQPNRQFELVHNFPTDYNFYLSRIREGVEGRWTVIEKYTSEPHAGSLIHEMYLVMGRVGGWLHVAWNRSGDVYHVARIVLATTLLALIAAFAKKSFGKTAAGVANENLDASSISSSRTPSARSLRENESAQNFVGSPQRWLWPFCAFLLAVTASSWPKPIIVDGAWRFGGYMPWWSVMDSLQRITFIPYILAGQALIVVLVMTLSQKQYLGRIGNVVFLGMLGFMLGMIFPPGLIFVYGVMTVTVCMQLILEKKGIAHGLSVWVVPYIGFVLVSAPSLAYLFWMTSIYPWKRLAEFDTIHPLPFDYIEYAKALGPMLPLGLMGLVIAVWKKEKVLVSSVAWVIAWLLLLGIFHFIPAQSPLRFTEMLPSVPLGFLTAYLALTLVHRFKTMRLGVL